MNIQIVMPVHNEEKRVVGVLEQIQKLKMRVVVVDDGSTDNSKAKIQKLGFKNVTLLEHKINLGKGSALKTGCDYAFSNGADAVIMMDSDGQHAVEDLSSFVEKLEEGNCDVIFGSRNLNLGVPFVRYVGNKIASVIVNIMFGIYVSDLISGYRAITKRAYEKIKWGSTGYGVETEMVIRVKKQNLKYCEIPVKTIYFDNYKGVSIIDAFGVFTNLIYWKFKI
jgi:glycosyltransferase involved in cell wall biosynthesis